ncbi:uncharacterized protein N7518_000208 [Penicillium psychrosexuale]|uniref:uncharacterized protein n=1 Tax=Penicillium psychrosexuale TaxID=1002107 RepID=UPI002544D63D|nr:uncharacterized protein N7518_000208 [Penicillium psychrosexuale]KAJ5803905.1 hypothetical protein N7518_000208 [Penicillium psychrosexuale]
MITETALLPDTSALQRNQDLMREFEKALEINPALNQKTVKELQDALSNDPEVDLLSIFPLNYARRRRFVSQTSEKIVKPDIME